MTVRKRKKNSRQRAGTTHGWGSMKKHRGKGNKGGSGRAGSSKRGDAKKPSYWTTRRFGKHGFHSIATKGKSVNLGALGQSLNSLVEAGTVKKDGDVYVVDLRALGYAKLLGRGLAPAKLKVSGGVVSAKAKERIEQAGGSVAE